jgi:hypothetical protein
VFRDEGGQVLVNVKQQVKQMCKQVQSGVSEYPVAQCRWTIKIQQA